MTEGEFEARLHAHRAILVEILVDLFGRETVGEGLRSALMKESVVSDQEEDPGVEPTEAFAIEAASADELRAILDTALERLAARRRRG